MDPVRQFVARKQQSRIPLHIILTTRLDAMGALMALRPAIPNDLTTGVLYAVDERKRPALNPMVYGPDGSANMLSGGQSIKADLEKFFAGEFAGRLPKPDGKAPASVLNAWFLAEMYDYSKLGGLRDKPDATAIADLHAATTAEFEKRRAKLGDPATADIARWQSLLRLASQMERFAPTKDLGKELTAALKLRSADKAFAQEVAAFKALHSVDANLASERKADSDKVKATYQGVAKKWAETAAGRQAASLLESLEPTH